MRAFLAISIPLLLASCGSNTRTIRIPESAVANPRKKKTPEPKPQPYVVKMSDGQRTWQIEIPVQTGSPSFSASIPLDLGALAASPPMAPQTEADREIIEAKKAAGEKVPEAKPGEEGKAQSYLGTIARVRELYKRRQYEMALVDLVALDRQYPDDVRILEMKGTLYMRLNRPKEARKAWERALSLDPNNESVARALEQLEDEE
jgi:tetratricopeptide (TPR) repeat protein